VEESLDLLRAREWHAGETVLDLGSGGGVPGIPLAVARQELRVVLVERSRARAAFLLSSLGQLGLGGVRVLARDAAELAGTGEVSGVDVMVSRAAVPPPRLLGLAARLLRPGGEGLVHVGSSFWDRGTAADLAPLFPTLTGLRVEAVGGSHLLRFAARLSR
ncbi:MAG: RsmG family class I SAM-dependent methyltransferase, partial [Candidatus Dormibacteria bacterium]